MKIATYYDPTHPPRQADDLALIELWKESWQKRGFETEVLCWRDAKLHALHNEFFNKIYQFPTVNGKAYEVTCFIRHLAFALSDARLFADYDMINYSFHFDPENIRFTAPFHSFFNGGPSLYTANKESIEWMIRRMMDWRHPETLSGQPHLSDQTVFLALPSSRSAECVDYGRDGWENAAVIHYSNHCFGMDKKAERIRLLKPI